MRHHLRMVAILAVCLVSYGVLLVAFGMTRIEAALFCLGNRACCDAVSLS